MKKLFVILIFSSVAIISGCAETTMVVPADAISCSKSAGCS